jgi:hypothetical protein
MSTLPTAKEKQQLEKISRAKHIHFVILVVLICIASLTFLFPNTSPLVIVVVGLSICGVGVSSMSLQYFRRCPRCDTRMSRGQAVCAACGLQFYASETAEQE